MVRPISSHLLFALAFVLALSVQNSAVGQEDFDEVARELSNPATPLASISNKLEFRSYDGDLPGADDQSSVGYLFQPVLPFVLDGGDKVTFRPAVPLLIDQPYFDGKEGRFRSGGGLGDVGFELVYVPKVAGKIHFGYGMNGGLPTGTNSKLRSENWFAGPEFFGVYVDTSGLAGGIFSHSWDVAGSGPPISLTALQYFGFVSLGDGWQVGTAPEITYNWKADPGDRWNVPIGIGIAKTTEISEVPVKFNAEIEYSVVRQDTFGPDWRLKLSITPVIKNPFQ